VAVGAGLNFLQADSIGIRNKRPVFWKNRFYGLIDQDGKPNTQAIFEEKKVISRIVPAKLSESNGPYILLLSKEKKMSLVRDNKIIIEPLYDSIGYSANQSNLRYYENNYQNEFRTALLNQKNEAEKKIFTPIMIFSDKASGFNIRIPVWKSGKQGYVDESGKVIIPPVFDRIDYFDDKAEIPNYSISDEGQTYSLGMKVAFIKSGEKWGLVNKESGKVLLSPKYDMIKSIHVPDVARYRYNRDPFSIKLENKYGLIDENGDELVPPIYDSPLEFIPGDESILLKKNGFYGLYLRLYGITHPVKYQKIIITTDGSYDVKINNKWGRVDYHKTLIPAIYDSQIKFNSEGVANVSINGRYSKIDYNGNLIEENKKENNILDIMSSGGILNMLTLHDRIFGSSFQTSEDVKLDSKNNQASSGSSERRWNYICNDCNKVKVLDSSPYDNSQCPETRWGGVGKATFAEGKHNYQKVARFGSKAFVCNICGLSINTDGKINDPGHCAATGNNSNHKWKN
jgi:hypothetical protein